MTTVIQRVQAQRQCVRKQPCCLGGHCDDSSPSLFSLSVGIRTHPGMHPVARVLFGAVAWSQGREEKCCDIMRIVKPCVLRAVCGIVRALAHRT